MEREKYVQEKELIQKEREEERKKEIQTQMKSLKQKEDVLSKEIALL